MTRQELADVVNRHLWTEKGIREYVTVHDIGRLERGETRWPREQRRAGLRAVLGAANDSDLGLYPNRKVSLAMIPGIVGRQDEEGVPELARTPGDPAATEAVQPAFEPDSTRREAVAAAGVAVPSASPHVADGLARITAALTNYCVPDQPEVVHEDTLGTAVTDAKRQYQSGRYVEAIDALPRVLALADAAQATVTASPRIHVLSADAHQTACSVLLKAGDVGSALLAADRSMSAANRSGDPVAVAASTRALAHALASSGYRQRALTVALGAADQLHRAGGLTTMAGLAVYGALLLRASAIAAAREDRTTASTALAEARDVASHLHDHDNTYWTYFCPINVELHRVSVAVSLGDAGQALDHACHIDPRALALAERRACLHLDVARAYLQWGKYDKAFEAVRAAEHAAPQEVTTRPAVHMMIAELQQRCPPSILRPVTQLARRVQARR